MHVAAVPTLDGPEVAGVLVVTGEGALEGESSEDGALCVPLDACTDGTVEHRLHGLIAGDGVDFAAAMLCQSLGQGIEVEWRVGRGDEVARG